MVVTDSLQLWRRRVHNRLGHFGQHPAELRPKLFRVVDVFAGGRWAETEEGLLQLPGGEAGQAPARDWRRTSKEGLWVPPTVASKLHRWVAIAPTPKTNLHLLLLKHPIGKHVFRTFLPRLAAEARGLNLMKEANHYYPVALRPSCFFRLVPLKQTNANSSDRVLG